jgi:hypothetical protein
MTAHPHTKIAGPGASETLFAAHPDGLALGAHARTCARDLERTFALRCVAERLHDWVGPRLCTTVFGATALLVLLAGCN